MIELAASATLALEFEGEHPPGARVSLDVAADELAQPRGARTGLPRVEFTEPLVPEGVEVVGLPAGAPLALAIHAGGELVYRHAEPLVLEAGERRVLVVDPAGGGRIVGTLSEPSGAPVAQREVWLLRTGSEEFDAWLHLTPGHRSRLAREATTDELGRFELVGLAAGRWWIGPAPADDDVAPFALHFTYGTEDELRLDLTAHRGHTIRGTVASRADNASAIRVSASRGDVQGNVRGRVDDGRFEIGPLLPGEWRVWAAQPGFERSPLVFPSAGESGVELVIPQRGSIAGIVIDGETGQPVQAHVSLVTGSGSRGTRTGAGGAGAFHFGGLDEGRYNLTAGTSDGRVGLIGDIGLAERQRVDDLELVVRPGARLGLELKGSLSRARIQIRCEGVVFSDFTLRNGTPVIEVVPPGRADVELYGWNESERVTHDQHQLGLVSGELEQLVLTVD